MIFASFYSLPYYVSKPGMAKELNPIIEVENGYDEAFGARPLKRFVTRELETLIAKKIIDNDIKYGDILNVSVKENKIIIN